MISSNSLKSDLTTDELASLDAAKTKMGCWNCNGEGQSPNGDGVWGDCAVCEGRGWNYWTSDKWTDGRPLVD